MTPGQEVQEARRKLGLSLTDFARRLGLGPRGDAQVRKWERDVGEPSAAALTAARLLVELEHERKLPWMTPELWVQAHFALEHIRNLAGDTRSRHEYRAFVAVVQVLNELLKREPK